MEGWQWAPDTQQGVQWNLGGGQAGEAGPHPGSLEGVDSLPEAMARSKQQASRRVSRSNSRQFDRMASQVRLPYHTNAYFQLLLCRLKQSLLPKLCRMLSDTACSELARVSMCTKTVASMPTKSDISLVRTCWPFQIPWDVCVVASFCKQRQSLQIAACMLSTTRLVPRTHAALCTHILLQEVLGRPACTTGSEFIA